MFSTPFFLDAGLRFSSYSRPAPVQRLGSSIPAAAPIPETMRKDLIFARRICCNVGEHKRAEGQEAVDLGRIEWRTDARAHYAERRCHARGRLRIRFGAGWICTSPNRRLGDVWIEVRRHRLDCRNGVETSPEPASGVQPRRTRAKIDLRNRARTPAATKVSEKTE